MRVQRPLFVKTFAGSAVMAKEMARRDFDVIAVDWCGNRHKPQFEVTIESRLDEVDIVQAIPWY